MTLTDVRDFLLIIFMCLLVLAGCTLVVVMLDKASCAGYSETTGKPTKYVAMECYIKDGGEWYAWSEYKYRLAARGQMRQL